MAKDEKLSFSFSSKTKSSSRPNPSKRPQPFDRQDPVTDSSQSKPQFVTVFDPTETRDAPPKLVIAPILNSSDFRSGGIKKMKNLDLPSDDHQHPESEPTKFVVDDSSVPSDNISYGLALRSAATDDAPAPAPAPQLQEDLMLKRYHEDMKNLPEDRGTDEFKEVLVEGFGAAILAGYGWSEGKGIGRNNKGDTNVVQYDRRAGTQVLGYQPSANDPIVKGKKGYAQNKNWKPEAKAPRIVQIVSGVRIELKSKVLKRMEGNELVLKLADSGEEARLDEEMVSELGSEAEERCFKEVERVGDS